MSSEPVPWGLGEYSSEQDKPLRAWFSGNWQRHVTVRVVSEGDLFGGENAMLEIRHATQNRVVHVPLAEALAAGMPEWAIAPETEPNKQLDLLPESEEP